MATTYIAIATVEVGAGGAANIDFSNIPQTYTDLVVKISARGDGATTSGNITFNGSTTNYTNRRIFGTGSTVASDSAGTAGIGNTLSNDTNYTANTFSNAESYIPNYTGSTNKSVSSDGVSETNATTALMRLSAGLWSDTAAITQITITLATGNFVQYSTATLYGIKNS